MNSSKRRYENKHKVTRIFLADYLVLKEFSQKAGLSMAEALHTIITREEQERPVETSQTRLPLEVIALSTPVTITKSAPVTRARSTPVIISFSRGVKRINGHKQVD